ncbi:PREDICTED: polymerase delta-interacting protein 3-like [Priapulus caudatus]|uniref:Polymerase delta-interacting protein 3-like n=1 Tax=Priapulus caudatus TaxID=37621 RepID=A0ABM1DU95_PRICU|nr:PREDICTED: polymerase delta-interacting protein 3-like [Priapulus caudatus]
MNFSRNMGAKKTGLNLHIVAPGWANGRGGGSVGRGGGGVGRGGGGVGRGGGRGRTVGFDARQKLQSKSFDARQLLKPKIVDAREKLKPKDARAKLNAKKGMVAVVDARQKIQARHNVQVKQSTVPTSQIITTVGNSSTLPNWSTGVQPHVIRTVDNELFGANPSPTPTPAFPLRRGTSNILMRRTAGRLTTTQPGTEIVERSVDGDNGFTVTLRNDDRQKWPAVRPQLRTRGNLIELQPMRSQSLVRPGAVAEQPTRTRSLMRADAMPQQPTRTQSLMRAEAMHASQQPWQGVVRGTPDVPMKRNYNEEDDFPITIKKRITSAKIPEVEEVVVEEDIISPLQGYKVLVTNLHPDVTEEDVVELFGAVGALRTTRLLRPSQGEVVYVKREDALAACRRYDSRELDGQPMSVILLTSGKPAATTSDLRGELLPVRAKGSQQPVPAVDVGLIHDVLFKKTPAPKVRPVTFRVKI